VDNNNTNDFNVDHEWGLTVNLSGLTAPTGVGNVDLPEGYYKVKVTDMYVNLDKNPNRVIIKMAIAEGPFTGTTRTSGLGIPRDDTDNVRYYWRGFAESAGFTPAQLDAGEVKLGLNTFKGRTAHIYFAPKDEEAGVKYEDLKFLPPMNWTQNKQGFEVSKAAAASRSDKGSAAGGSALGSGTGGSTIEAPLSALGGDGGSNSGSNTTTKSSLLGQLGLN
jgi:hypothetical protein